MKRVTKKYFKLFGFFIMATLLFYTFSYSQINKRNIKQSWKTDKSKHIIPLNELIILLKRDAIKPIDNPMFLKKAEAMKIFYEKEPVIAVEINGKAKAYPLGILNLHEIVNDEIDNIKFSVTFCPLCYSTPVFYRKIKYKGKEITLDFGTSGMLRKSNLVMWDRQTESWWQQITGTGIVGELAGVKLKELPSMLISVEDFFKAYPDGKILSPSERMLKKGYGFNPYYKYDDLKVKKPRLFFDKIDSRFPPMERIFGIKTDKIIKAYPYPKIRKLKIINDKIGEKDIVIFYKKGQVSVVDERLIKNSRDVGTTTIFLRNLNGKILKFKPNGDFFTDTLTNSRWDITGHCIEGKLKGKKLTPLPYSVEFSFVWFSFFPNSIVYK